MASSDENVPLVGDLAPAESAAVTPTKGAPVYPPVLDPILSTLGGFHNDELRRDLLKMLECWNVKSLEDLAVFSENDVKEYIQQQGTPSALSSPKVSKQLGFVVAFARIRKPLSTVSSIQQIIRSVDEYRTASMGMVRFPGSPSRSATEKKTVPDLTSFSGKDEDFYSWRDDAVNAFGKAGLVGFLTDKPLITKHPEMAVSVFYALRAALQGGTASTLSTALYDEKQYDPSLLWKSIEAWYNTVVNRANVVLFEVKRLLNLRLDADTLPTRFISDFRESLLRLRKNKVGLADDTDTLRALLLVAIQDDQFEQVRDTIIKEPDRPIDTLLKDLRDRETSVHIKDSTYDDKSPRSARRVLSGTNFSNNKYHNPNSNKPRGWYIPEFPESWEQSFGSKLFCLLQEWRSEAMFKKASQAKLNDNFATRVEMRKVQQRKCTGRQAKAPPDASQHAKSDDATEQPSSTNDTDGFAMEDRQVKRICLCKSRRVVTEKKSD